LPADYLNIVPDRRYTVEEAQDLINRRLLSRGFTMLRNGDVLSVVNIKKLDPSMVPRVSPEELAGRNPHEFVRVSFRLDWLLAEQAVTEFEPMRSPNGKLIPLKETNRLEAMDAVINLREIYRLITEEQAGDSQKQLVKEFKLKHTRASKVLEQLQTLLGLDKSSKAAGPLTPQQIQAQQLAAARSRSQPGKKLAAGAAKQKAEVYLVINVRENSILVNAPPDKMAIVNQAIEIIDVPANAANSLIRNLDRMRVYRLAALDPDTLVKVLEEVGSLDYDTKLEVDTKSKAVIAYASLADHLTIQSVVDRLDGSGRSFEVIQLRRLESDYVAGTIEAMMGGQEEKKKQSS
jgi:type II secretory pathway component GspD/PulD (secretin)